MAHYSHHSPQSPCSACLYEHGIDARVVVMGSSGVGKTSLLRRYTQNQFDPSPPSLPTTAPSFVTKKVRVGETKVRLQLWDTPGRPSFRTMAPMYYRDADAALLLYDCAKPSSSDELREWLEELKQNSPDLLIYIVGINTAADTPKLITLDVVRRLVRSWFPPTKPTLAPPPSPATKKNTFSSYLRFPFRSLSLSLSSSSVSEDEPSSASVSNSQRSNTYRGFPVTSTNSPLHISTSSMTERNGAKYRTFVQMRRTQSELPGSCSSSISDFGSIKSLHHTRSFSSLRSMHSQRHLGDDANEVDESNSLPNKVEFFECSLQDKIEINGVFQHLIQAIVHKAQDPQDESEDTDASSTSSMHNASRSSTPSPPPTPTSSPSSRNPYCYSMSTKEKRLQDGYYYSQLYYP